MSITSSLRAESWYAGAPLVAPDWVRELGPTIVIAPHPDDEVLGCGGTMALLRVAGIPVYIVVVSDGAASHPGSVRYPPPALAALRQTELLAGVAHLGIAAEQVAFLGLPDGGVPLADSPDGARAVTSLGDVLRALPPFQTALLPWRRDPHSDHRATSSLATAALDAVSRAVRRLEYPIWARVGPGPDDLPRPDEATLWRVDISTVSQAKRAAILAHESQTTDMIDDATISYCLPDAVLERFAEPYELFLEVTGR